MISSKGSCHVVLPWKPGIGGIPRWWVTVAVCAFAGHSLHPGHQIGGLDSQWTKTKKKATATWIASWTLDTHLSRWQPDHRITDPSQLKKQIMAAYNYYVMSRDFLQDFCPFFSWIESAVIEVTLHKETIPVTGELRGEGELFLHVSDFSICSQPGLCWSPSLTLLLLLWLVVVSHFPVFHKGIRCLLLSSMQFFFHTHLQSRHVQFISECI